MFFLIADQEVVGDSLTPVTQLPEGWECVDGPDKSAAEVYWDGAAIQIRPPRPNPLAYWETNQWVTPAPPTPIPVQDWRGLEADFRGSEIYAKVYTATITPDSNTIAALLKLQRAASAHTLLLSALTSTRSEADLQFAIAEIRAAMASMAIGDFTAAQIDYINERLEARGFDLRLSDEP